MVYTEQQENTTPQIQIGRLTLSQIDTSRPDIVELITRSYKHENRSPERQAQDAVNEFQHGEDRTIIYLAEEGEKAVAALILVPWKDSPADKRGSVFWPKLAQSSPEIYKKAVAFNRLSLDIASVATLPEYQGKGIARTEIEQAITDLQPAIITGQTKTPGAVVSLANAAGKNGYRVFYGNMEVTPDNPPQETASFQPVLEAFLATNDDSKDGLEPEGVVYPIKSDFITPEIPDISKLPPRNSESI